MAMDRQPPIAGAIGIYQRFKRKMLMKFNRLNGLRNPKQARKLLRTGTFLLFDTANLLASTGYKHAARTLDKVSEQLASHGYRVVFFLERRSYAYVCRRQGSAQDVDMFKTFTRRRNFVLLGEELGEERSESDDAMLQLAEVLPDSVCISGDRFRDYAAIHPDIVKSDRVRGFTVLHLDDKKYIIIMGLKCAIKIDGMGNDASSVGARSVPEVKVSPISVKRDVDDSGLCAKVDGARRAGHPEVKSSKKALAAIRELASYNRGDDWDGRSLLDAKKEARRIRSALRNERLRARAIREGSWRFVHFSHKRRKAAGIAALGAKLVYGRIA